MAGEAQKAKLWLAVLSLEPGVGVREVDEAYHALAARPDNDTAAAHWKEIEAAHLWLRSHPDVLQDLADTQVTGPPLLLGDTEVAMPPGLDRIAGDGTAYGSGISGLPAVRSWSVTGGSLLLIGLLVVGSVLALFRFAPDSIRDLHGRIISIGALEERNVYYLLVELEGSGAPLTVQYNGSAKKIREGKRVVIEEATNVFGGSRYMLKDPLDERLAAAAP